MELSQIRELLQIEIARHDFWLDLLSDTSPGNYGLNSFDIEVQDKGFWVDIPNRAFSFKEALVSANLVMGASKGDSSFDQSFSTVASGKGSFDFDGPDKVIVFDLEAAADMSIY